MTSLLTRSALDKLPSEIRDHIRVVNETGYSITMSMTIGDFERLVGHFTAISDLRDEAEEAQAWKRDYEAAADDLEEANAEVDRLEKVLDKAVDGLNGMIAKWEENGTGPTLDHLRGLVESL